MSEPNTNIRSYEVSVWTLQDSFLAVLKWSELGVKGTILEPKLTLNSDGTLNFSFTIPMKLYIDGELRDNPIWYNTTNGNLLANMRKIKVIFNKKTIDEEVYEFLITKMTMKHALDSPTCEVDCENGLAYHELGKQGYKLELSSAVFYDKDLQEFKKSGKSIAADLKYWCEEQLNLPEVPLTNLNEINIDKMDPRKWYYKIEMDWSSFSSSPNRQSNLVYEESYVSSWVTENNKAVAAKIEDAKVKERLIDEQNSNLYNLTLSLATKFNVYCRYLYLYDNNYHIRARIIIFYNNFLNDDPEKLFQFLYPYSTTEVSREVDGTDIVTKMYIDTIESNTATGVLSIMNSDANKMREDYLLNFDYMYGDAQGITEELYEAIADYESKIKELNDLIIPLLEELAALENLRVDVDAKLAVEKNAKTLADAEISTLDALIINLTNGTGTIVRDNTNPDILYAARNSEYGTYIHILNKGIIKESYDDIKIYSTYNAVNHTFNAQRDYGATKILDDGTMIVKWIKKRASSDPDIDLSTPFYLTYSYEPITYLQKVKEDYEKRSDTAGKKIAQYTQLLADIDTRLGDISDALSAKLEQKELLVADFELMMGPALREGHWTPEDYSNYGNKYIEEFTFGNEKLNYAQAIWDDKLFPEELHLYYTEGINEEKKFYPIIMLKGENGVRQTLWTNILKKLKANKNISLVFYDGPEAPDKRIDANYKIIPLGAGLEIVFITRYATINNELDINCSAFLITELLSMDEIKLLFLSGEIGIVSWENDQYNFTKIVDTSNFDLYIDKNNVSVTSSAELLYVLYDSISSETYTPYKIILKIPRIKINSLDLMTSEDKLAIRYHNLLLEEYEDYSLLLYSPEDDNNTIATSMIDSYCITIKLLSLLFAGSTAGDNILYEDVGDNNIFKQNFKLHYYIANASTSIYLDALTILKENAFPKVSYSLTPNVINMDIHKRLYSFLTRIININDIELKLHEAYGYISEIELDLDLPWNDTITVQNYKNKFEDIFSTITVLSEEMLRREYLLNETVQLVDVVTKEVNPEMLQKTISTSVLDYDFNAGTLTFTENEGITGLSDLGIITMRGSGIFTATEKDVDGNWVWNNAILPSGINAALIKAGLLDTQKIMIYSGNDVKFLWNSNGIYAYEKDYRENSDEPYNGKYALYNSLGLSLYDINNNSSIKLVEVGWQGFIIRNPLSSNIDHKVFYADTNGNLNITGIINAQSGGTIGGWDITNTSLKNTGSITNMILRGKTDSDGGNDLGGGAIGIFTRLGSTAVDHLTVGGTDYYLYTLSNFVDGKNELYAAGPDDHTAKTGVNLYDYEETSKYTAKYKIKKLVPGGTYMLYVSWVPVNNDSTDPNDPDNPKSDVSPAADPRVMYYTDEDNNKIYPYARRLELNYSDSTPEQIYSALSETINTTDNIIDLGQIITTSTHNPADYIAIEKEISMQYKATSSDSLSIALKTLEPAFSLYGSTGRIETNLGKLGSFEFNAEKMKNGKFDRNVSFEILSSTGEVITKTLDDLGKCFVEAHFWGGKNRKVLYLKRLNGEEIRIPNDEKPGWYVTLEEH